MYINDNGVTENNMYTNRAYNDSVQYILDIFVRHSAAGVTHRWICRAADCGSKVRSSGNGWPQIELRCLLLMLASICHFAL